MYRRAMTALVCVLVCAGAPASATWEARASTQTALGVTVVTAPADVTQGDKYDVVVRVASPRRARTVQIQTQTTDIFGAVQWTFLKSVRVAGQAKRSVPLVATGVGRQRFRALVTYRDAKPATSRPFGTTVWQWTVLSRIPSYYSTGGVADYSGAQFGMNGDQYVGWFTHYDYGMWEARYTPGRNCKAFRGVFGVTDDSSDGSSGEFTLLTDETDVVYQSPSLVPGAVETVQLELANPYRFAIQARDTSPDGLAAYPAIGNPEFLCNTAY